MKYTHAILIALCSFIGTMLSQASQFTPENTFFVFDIDDVLVKPHYLQRPNLILGGLWYKPLNSHNYIASLMELKNAYQRDAHGNKALCDQDGFPVNGLSFQFLYHGMRDHNLAAYVPWMIQSIETSRTTLQGTREICQYLKDKGYVVVFATNKDRPSYDIFAKNSDITQLPERVFVSHTSTNINTLEKIKAFAQHKDTPSSYKAFAYAALTVKPTERIRHIPHAKPNTAYYEYVHTTMTQEEQKQHMIFIDDKKDNIDGVKEYQNKSAGDSCATGIHFKNPYQLTQKLIKLGILSPIHDHEFIEKMKKHA